MTQLNDGTFTGRRTFAVRVATTTPDKLAAIALERGFYFVGKGGERQGSAGALMDAIADGDIMLP